MLWIVVGALTVGLVAPAAAAPGRMLFMGCNPMQQGPALYVADPDGNDIVRVMTPPVEIAWGCGAWPDLSPDGSRVAYVAEDELAVLRGRK